MNAEEKRERNRIASKKWRDNHPEKQKENNRLKWIKHGHKYLQKYIEMNQYRKEYFKLYYQKNRKSTKVEEVKPVYIPKIEPDHKPKKIDLFHILDVLRKEPKSKLYYKPVPNWSKVDWHIFNELERKA